jgi:hypothetical protein
MIVGDNDLGGIVLPSAADIAGLADEVTRYLQAVDLCGVLGLRQPNSLTD